MTNSVDCADVNGDDGRADGPLKCFEDAEVGDWGYLNGKVNSVSSGYELACFNVLMIVIIPNHCR